MPLNVIRRKDRDEALTITGTVAGQRIRRRAQSNSLALAREEAAAIEAEILRTAWHGERRGARSFAAAVNSYLETAPRSANHKARLHRLLKATGDIPLSEANQAKAIELKRIMLRPDAAPGTYTRAIVMPMRAVLWHAHAQGWCDAPQIIAPRENQGRTLFLMPDEAERLIDAAAPHLKPLILFLIGTGARMSEALELEWRDVDLVGRRAILWRTKNGNRRTAQLPSRVVAALAEIRGISTESTVFVANDGESYADRERRYGGQIKTAWAGAIRRAGLNPELTPHACRHTWATWHYAIHKDPLKLKIEGGWSSLALVERYAHLMPAGHEAAIHEFLGTTATPVSLRYGNI